MADNKATLFAFKADLQKFSRAIGVGLEQTVRKVTLDLHDRIVERTPVKTGRARGSWGISLDQPGDYVLPAGDYGGDAASGIAQQQQDNVSALSAENPYRTVWIFNNLPYAEALENGHSQKAPTGMVAVSLAEVEAGIDAILEIELNKALTAAGR